MANKYWMVGSLCVVVFSVAYMTATCIATGQPRLAILVIAWVTGCLAGVLINEARQ